MGAGVMESSEVSVGFNAVLSGSGEGVAVGVIILTGFAASLFPGTMTGFIGRTVTEVFFLLSLVLLLKL